MMDKFSPPQNHRYGRFPLLMLNSSEKENFKLPGEEGTVKRSTSPFPANHTFGGLRKVSLVSLKRIGSVLSFPPSRKTSVRSVNSVQATIGSNKVKVRENSGQFDGCSSRTRKYSSGTFSRKRSTSSNSRKLSSNSQRESVIAEICQDLEQLKELEFSSSSEEEDNNNNNVNNTEDLERQKRVEMYINDHSDIYKRLSFHMGDEADHTSMFSSEKRCDSERTLELENDISKSDDSNVYIPSTTNLQLTEDPPKTLKTRNKTAKGSKWHTKRYSTKLSDIKDGFYSPHTEMTSKRLTRLFLDTTNEVNASDSFHGDPRVNDLKNSGKPRSRSLIKPSYAYNDYLQAPESVYNTFPRGSLHSIASTHSAPSTANSDPVPMNFIPGQTKPMTSKQRSNSLGLNYIRKARFCFKGVTVQIDKSMPRTYKAMAHAGMLCLSVMGPSDHRCSH